MASFYFAFVLLFYAVNAWAISAEEILAKADAIRNPAQSYLMKVEVKSTQDTEGDSVFKVSIQGNDKTFVETLAPAKDRGRNLLMLDENMWAFIPNLNRAVRVGLNQRLSGQAANGDISRMRWSGDYDAKIESSASGQWILFLSAKKKGLTYDKLRIWVDQKNFYPLKAEFLTLSGKVIKKATYGTYVRLADTLRPSEITIQDAIRPDDRSTLHILEMTPKTFPASLFNQNSMK